MNPTGLWVEFQTARPVVPHRLALMRERTKGPEKARVKCLVWRHVRRKVEQLAVYCKHSGIQPAPSFNAL